MDQLTAIRSFGNPGYTPVMSRIYTARWYFCTFQNTESDIGGGHYLAEGEYVELLPGEEARHARDRHLNHLNAIREHKDNVYAVTNPQRCNAITYHESEAAATAKVALIRDENARQLEGVQVGIAAQVAKSDEAITHIYGQCSDWKGLESWRQSQRDLLPTSESFWCKLPTIERVK